MNKLEFSHTSYIVQLRGQLSLDTDNVSTKTNLWTKNSKEYLRNWEISFIVSNIRNWIKYD